MINFSRKVVRKICSLFDSNKNNSENLNRSSAPVQLHDLVLIGGSFFDSPMKIIESLKNSPDNKLLEKGDFYPLFYNSNPRTLELLKMLIKEVRPKTVIETGVANGISTRQILSSFKEYQLGDSKLYSFDIDYRVGTPDLLRDPQFNFVVIDSQNSFLDAMKEIKSVDLFYHDSDHSYHNQMLEYETAWKILNPKNGVLISDDINWSNAFLDFCKKVNRTPLLLSDGAKFAGIICKDNPKN
jgi:predicted O-methyltransferase YrrM